MSLHDDEARFRDMLDYAVDAQVFIHGRVRGDLETDRMLSLALTRAVEVIGEAASRVSPEGRARLPGIPWTQIVGMRNRLIHAYTAVDQAVLWDVVKYDLPVLIAALKAVITD